MVCTRSPKHAVIFFTGRRDYGVLGTRCQGQSPEKRGLLCYKKHEEGPSPQAQAGGKLFKSLVERGASPGAMIANSGESLSSAAFPHNSSYSMWTFSPAKSEGLFVERSGGNASQAKARARRSCVSHPAVKLRRRQQSPARFLGRFAGAEREVQEASDVAARALRTAPPGKSRHWAANFGERQGRADRPSCQAQETPFVVWS